MTLSVARLEQLHGFLMISAPPSSFSRPGVVVDHHHRSPSGCCRSVAVHVQSSPASLAETDRADDRSPCFGSPLSMSIEDLADSVFEGRTHPAQQLWKSYYRIGLDPLRIAEGHGNGSESSQKKLLLGRKSLRQLHEHFGGLLRESVADLACVSTSTDGDEDGTTKLLITLKRDGRQVETVIIPWWNKGDDNGIIKASGSAAAAGAASAARAEYSTLCVSSQVGCRQACSFCRTGMQGLARSLTADEILAQVVLANSVIHGHHRHRHSDVPLGIESHRPQEKGRRLPEIGNVVFMGMGEPADNARAVVTATRRLVDPRQFALAPRRVTVSTVSPSPDAFRRLLGMGAVAPRDGDGENGGDTGVQLAWSLHSSRDEIRKLLVPTTRHTVEELREGLIDALSRRSKKRRSVLIEMTMLDSVNDSEDDAIHLASFCSEIVRRVDGVGVVVNLIPWNDIRAPTGPAARYRPSSSERVLAYQDALVRRGIRCYVRTTRGDDDLAACGQLSTAARLKALPE